MAWTTQRKAFVGVLMVAGAALIADRVMFGAAPLGAAPAGAAQSPSPAKPQPAAVTAPTASPPGLTLVARLEALREEAKGADPFESPFVPSAAVAESQIEQPTVPEFDSAAWAGRHKLTVIMRGKPNSFAMIGGKVYRVGDTLDGLTLVRIDSQTALFEGEAGKAELVVRPGESR